MSIQRTRTDLPPLYPPGSNEYESTVAVFNGRASTGARFVARPSTVSQVQTCVEEARGAGWSISVRGGGHGIAGRALTGELIVDMGEFRHIRDLGDTVTVGSGCTWAELDRYGASRGWVVPGGTVSTTGVAGLTLGGGVGWLLPSLGLTCDSLVRLSATTGNSELLQLDDSTDGEAMRLARGFGHGWLIVNEFEFVHHPLPTRIEGGSIEFHPRHAFDVLATLLSASPSCPDSINWSPALISRQGEKVVSVDGASFGEDSFEEWVRSACGVTPSSISVREHRYPELQSMLDNPDRWGQRSGWRSIFAEQIDLSAIAELVDVFYASKFDSLQIFVERMCGAAKNPRLPSSFALRSANFDVLIAASWLDEARDNANLASLNDAKDRITSKLGNSALSSTYSNYAGRSERTVGSGVRAALKSVRGRYDVEGVFVPCY